MEEIDRRKSYSDDVVGRLLHNLPAGRDYVKAGNVCVYATGSTGRGEASVFSDLDLIMLTQSKLDGEGEPTIVSNLSPLDEICVKADFIRSIRSSGFRELDGQGKYFANFTSQRLIKSIGAPDDDVTGAFTARLLLLLESRALIGGGIHRDAIDRILSSYWSDFPNHSEHFIPAYFTNDILRLWRTFCVNYEARTKSLVEDLRFKKRVKNLKLKYNRMITCYSALLYLLNEFDIRGTVTTQAALDMCLQTPIERIQHIRAETTSAAVKSHLREVLERYNGFLVVANRSEEALVEYMRVAGQFEVERKSAYTFGHAIYKSLDALGNGNDFHRLMVV